MHIDGHDCILSNVNNINIRMMCEQTHMCDHSVLLL